MGRTRRGRGALICRGEGGADPPFREVAADLHSRPNRLGGNSSAEPSGLNKGPSGGRCNRCQTACPMPTLVVNPVSIRPTWPPDVTYEGDKRVGPFPDAVTMAFAVEGLDTEEDLDVSVTDADGRSMRAIILEPGWCAVAHVAHAEQKWSLLTYRTVELASPNTSVACAPKPLSRIGIQTRAETPSHFWDTDAEISLWDHLTPVAVADLRQAWLKGSGRVETRTR